MKRLVADKGVFLFDAVYHKYDFLPRIISCFFMKYINIDIKLCLDILFFYFNEVHLKSKGAT